MFGSCGLNIYKEPTSIVQEPPRSRARDRSLDQEPRARARAKCYNHVVSYNNKGDSNV